jgi:hypothetical protein
MTRPCRLLALLTCIVGCAEAPEGGVAAGAEPRDVVTVGPVAAPPASIDVEPPSAPVDSPEDGPADPPPPEVIDSGPPPRFERPEHVRGLYLNAWASGSTRRIAALLDVAARTEINTFVIDIKDASGFVSHRTSVPLAREVGATGEIRIRDLQGLLRRLHAAGVYPIARIVVVRDPVLTQARPDLAAQDTAGNMFVDEKGIVWVNPYNRVVWDYNIALAREVAEMGFPEIQWDYVRFPDITATDRRRVVYPGANGQRQVDAIRDFLTYSSESLSDLGLEITADVFGVTTSAARDVGIGQVWESFIGAVDVALPMVYPSHYWKGSFGYDTPNAFPYEIVRHALEDALEKSATVEGAGTTRPWLQDFSLGQPRYGVPEVRAQIQATYDAGIGEWILWNPGSRYTEDALEPNGGFPVEPEIRVANQTVPVSRRWEFVDSVRPALGAVPPVPPAIPADTVAPLPG